MLMLLNYADMTIGPDGTYMSIDDRITDIANRYGDESWQVKKAIELANQIQKEMENDKTNFSDVK